MAKIRAEEERLEAAEWRKGSNTRAEAKCVWCRLRLMEGVLLTRLQEESG